MDQKSTNPAPAPEMYQEKNQWSKKSSNYPIGINQKRSICCVSPPPGGGAVIPGLAVAVKGLRFGYSYFSLWLMFLLIIDGFFWRSWLICVLTFFVACFFVLVDCCDSFLMVFVLSLMFYWLRVIMLDCFWLLVECEWLFLDVCWLLLLMVDSFWFCLIILIDCLWLCLIVFDCSLFFVHWFRLLSIAVECFWLLSCALSDLQIGISLKNTMHKCCGICISDMM